MANYAIKSERVTHRNPASQAYTLFERERGICNRRKTDQRSSTSRQAVSWKAAATATDSTRPSRPRKVLKVEAATQTFATITLQNYFRMYHKLAGMTGTAITEAGEFWDIYKLDVVTIPPTNRCRFDLNDRVYRPRKKNTRPS